MVQDPMMNTFLSLLLIVGVLGGVLYFVKRIAIKSRQKNKDGLGMEVISRFALQPKTNLFVIKVGKKKLLIGANEHTISTLADLTDEAENITKSTQRRTSNPEKQVQNKVLSFNQKENELVDNLSFKAFLNQTFKKS